jgi:hypothetical protein
VTLAPSCRVMAEVPAGHSPVLTSQVAFLSLTVPRSHLTG